MKKPSFKALVYVQQFFGDCMPIYPLYALMFSEQGGLDNSEISLLFLGWVVFAMLAEVPTGIIADKFSRKMALIYSYLLQGSAFMAWLVFPNFWGYLAGFLLWGIGYAFSSGTFQAYLYEELRAHGHASSFNRVFARSQSLKLVGMVVAYTLASAVGARHYTAALLLSTGFSVLAAGLICFFPYKSRRARASDAEVQTHWSILRAAGYEVRKSKKISAIVIALGVLLGIIGTMEEFTPLFYSHSGFSAEVIPLILAAGLLLSSLVGWFAHRLERLRFTTVASLLVVAGAVFFAATFGKLIGLFGVLLFMRLIMLAQTLFAASLQHTIDDERRATISSLAAFAGEVLSLITLGIASVLFAALDDTATYRILALGFVALGLLLMALGRTKGLRAIKTLSKDVPVAIPGRPV